MKKTDVETSVFSSAEREGFEPTVSCPTPVFKTGALNHSAISPNEIYFSIRIDPAQDRSDKKVLSGGNLIPPLP